MKRSREVYCKANKSAQCYYNANRRYYSDRQLYKDRLTILDNENSNLKVHEWIAKYTEEDTVDIVTGYFTIGALAYPSRQVNYKITNFRLVLGDIVNFDKEENRPLDLLNENITIEAALRLNSLSKEAVSFLKQDQVQAKTLEPNFCHAKC